MDLTSINTAIIKYAKAAIKAFYRNSVVKALTQASINLANTTNLLELKICDKKSPLSKDELAQLESKYNMLNSEVVDLKKSRIINRPPLEVIHSQQISHEPRIKEEIKEEADDHAEDEDDDKIDISEIDKLLIEGDCCFFGHGASVDYEKAKMCYNSAAKLHSGLAYFRLGSMYEKGTGTRVNYGKAIDCYLKGDSLNEPNCQYALGQLIERGVMNNQSKKVALEYYKKAADQNCAIAKTRLGYFYENGIEVNKDVEKAIKLYYEASEDQEPIAKNFIGLFFFKNGNHRLAYDFFKQSADVGVARALNNLGICYEYGYGVEKNIEMAMKCYIESAEKGYSHGMVNIGKAYLKNGTNSKSTDNISKGIYWLRSAIMKSPNLTEANFYLGIAYESGLGVDKDLGTAFCYYKKAAKQKHPKALKKCGDLIYSGFNTVNSDKEEAFKLYQQAALIGENEAYNCMGLMFEQGFGGYKPNLSEAISCYEKANIYGSLEASVNLAVLHLGGKLENSDKKKAEELLLGAAKRGNERARNILLKMGIVPIVKDMEDESHAGKKIFNEGQTPDYSFSPESKTIANNAQKMDIDDDIRSSNIRPQLAVDVKTPC